MIIKASQLLLLLTLLLAGCGSPPDDDYSGAATEKCPAWASSALCQTEVHLLELGLEDIPQNSDWVLLQLQTENGVRINGTFVEDLPNGALSLPRCGALMTEGNWFTIQGPPFGTRVVASPLGGEPVVDQQRDLIGGWNFVFNGWTADVVSGASFILFGYGARDSWHEVGGDFSASLEFSQPVHIEPVASGQMACLSDPLLMDPEVMIEANGAVSVIENAEWAFSIEHRGLGRAFLSGNAGYAFTLERNGELMASGDEVGPSAPSTGLPLILGEGDYFLRIPYMRAVNDFATVAVLLVDVPEPYATALEAGCAWCME